MKVRSSHVTIMVLAVIGAVLALAYMRTSARGPVKSGESPTDRFLENVKEIRESGKGSDAATGMLPSAGVDMSQRADLQFSENPVYMGVIPSNKPTEKRIKVKNPGKIPIKILDIRTSCHCTEGAFERSSIGSDGQRETTIEPGAEETLIVTVDPSRIPAFHSDKLLTLTTNDPVKSEYKIPVTSDVDPEISVDPETIDFGTVDQGSSKQVHVLIRQLTSQPLEITAAQMPDASEGNGKSGIKRPEPVVLSVAKRPESEWATPGKSEWDLTAELQADAPPGEIALNYWLVTNLKRGSLGFKIQGKVVSFYQVTPASLGARNAAKPGDKRVAEASIVSADPIGVSDVAVTGGDLSLEVVPKPGSKDVDIYLNVLPGATSGLKNETVSFTVAGNGHTSRHSMRAYVSVQSNAPKAQ